MITIPINEPEFAFIELFRVALSEPNLEQRLHAIKNVKHEVVAARLEILASEENSGWLAKPINVEFSQWIAETSGQRYEAAFELSETGRRHEVKNQRQIKIAEHIGNLIWLSIQNKKFEGVQTARGILQQVRDDAKETSVAGARDKDTLRKIWKMYRGVVHLGMAIDYCEDYPAQEIDLLHLSELFRQHLSESCPKGTKKPYVNSGEQISFIYLSKLWGGRFQDRGLSFDII